MSSEEVLKNVIARLGQSQSDRAAVELGAHFVDVDERTPEERLVFAKSLAKFIQFVPRDGSAPKDWTSLFEDIVDLAAAKRLLESSRGDVPPHLALLAAFVQLFEAPRRVVNRFTERHLDFHFRRALGFATRPAVPDRAHVVASLKKNTGPLRVLPRHALSAGKDATGIERIYRPVRETIVIPGAVERLASIFSDATDHDTVRASPIANSANGLGAPLPNVDPSWPIFGDSSRLPGEIGFALSSAVLRMREGERKIRVTLSIVGAGAEVSADALGAALDAFVTGEKGWLGPYDVSAKIAGTEWTLELTVPQNEKSAVVDYDAKIHGYAFGAASPVVQFHLRGGGPLGRRELRASVVRRATVHVDVKGVTSLVLESDTGALDPKKTFLPFGSQPGVGARFFIGDSETLSKRLVDLSVSIRWHGRRDFAVRYADYGEGTSDAYFTATAVYQDATGHALTRPRIPLFGADAETTIPLTPGSLRPVPTASTALHIDAFHKAGTRQMMKRAEGLVLVHPVFLPLILTPPTPTERAGFITLALEKGFLHDLYRKKTIENVLKYSKQTAATPGPTILDEPYTPAIEHIELSYQATSTEVDLESPTVDAFAHPGVAFFHLDCFGPRREHAYLRSQYDFVVDKRVPLLPDHAEGELFVGISGIGPRDGVSLLVQVSDGSADPDMVWPGVTWSVLCDNYFRPLGSGELVLDTTNALRTSGLVVVDIPKEATTTNTVLPSGYLWFRVSVGSSALGVSRLLAVIANAIEVVFEDQGNDPRHFDAPLGAGSIAKWKTPIAGVTGVAQPFASFGGTPQETAQALHVRAAERLRHKDRAITPWDYERLVLQRFSSVDRVKCIPHSKVGHGLSPGHVLLIVVPSLRGRHAADPLRPKVDTDTIARIQSYLQERTAMGAEVHVKNPSYEIVRLDFKVKMRPGFPFNVYRAVLEQELIAFLSPWAFDDSQRLSFGGQIYRSTLLDFVERRDYVDYVVDFKLLMPSASTTLAADVGEARPSAADAILVSDNAHAIAEAI